MAGAGIVLLIVLGITFAIFYLWLGGGSDRDGPGDGGSSGE